MIFKNKNKNFVITMFSNEHLIFTLTVLEQRLWTNKVDSSNFVDGSKCSQISRNKLQSLVKRRQKINNKIDRRKQQTVAVWNKSWYHCDKALISLSKTKQIMTKKKIVVATNHKKRK